MLYSYIQLYSKISKTVYDPIVVYMCILVYIVYSVGGLRCHFFSSLMNFNSETVFRLLSLRYSGIQGVFFVIFTQISRGCGIEDPTTFPKT